MSASPLAPLPLAPPPAKPPPPSTRGRLLRNTAALSAAQIARIGFNAVLSILVARQLGAEALGKFAILTAYWMVFQVVATAGVPRFMIRAIARDPADYRPQFQQTLVNQGLAAVAAGLAMAAVASLLNHPVDTTAALYVAALALLPAAVVSACETVFQGLEQMTRITVAQVTATAVQLVLSVALLDAGYGIVGLAWALFAGQLCTALIQVIGARRLALWQGFTVQARAVLQLFPASFDFYLTSLAVVVFSKLDVLVVSQLVGEEATGLYNAAFLLIQVVNFVSVSYSSAAYPVLSSLFVRDPGHYARLLRKSLAYGTAATTLAAIWLAIGAYPIIQAVYGLAEYGQAATLLRYCSPFVVIFLWNALLAAGLMAGNQQRSSVVVAGVKLVAGVAYYLTLTARFGLAGAAVATVLAGLTGTALNHYYLSRRLAVHHLTGAMLRPLAVGAVVAAAALWVDALPWPVLLAATSAAYLALLAAFGLIDKDDWRLVRGSL